MGFIMKKITYITVLLIIISNLIYSQNNESLENKMNNYIEKVKLDWKYNPLRTYETDKYFSPWLDPNNYNTSFWLGDILNDQQLYPNNKFHLKNILLYFDPKIAVDLAPIAFNIDEDKHRFRIGVGYSLNYFLEVMPREKINYMVKLFYLGIICK